MISIKYKFYQKGLPMYRIFIVEDDEIIANLLKKNLCSWGYDVSCAQDFSNIIQEFARLDPQLVLLDLSCHFTMVFTGVRKSAESLRYRSSLFPPLPIT